MKIVGIEVNRYALPLNPPFVAAWDPTPRANFYSTIVFVHTDQGLTGIGSGDAMMGFGPYASLFLGESPFAIE